MAPLALAVMTLGSLLSAQTKLVSPRGLDTREGSTFSRTPWTDPQPRRYMQIHDDVGGRARIVTKLAFRMNQGAGDFRGTRLIDLELFIGHGPKFPSASMAFDRNYRTPRTRVINRKVVTFGPQGIRQNPGPNPFTAKMDLFLERPFAYDGKDSLVWEAVIFSNTGSGSNAAADADVAPITRGTSTKIGIGCTPSQRKFPMQHSLTHADVGGAWAVNFTVASAPLNTPVLLAIGGRNPDLTVPGLCSPLLTDLGVTVLIGLTDAFGQIDAARPADSTLILNNTFGGAVLFSQCHALDTGRKDRIKVANSHGRTFTVPRPNRSRTNRVVRVQNRVGKTTAKQGVFLNTSTVGYAVVTEFTFK